jgi:transcriptional regulator with XRE-family HTH domain
MHDQNKTKRKPRYEPLGASSELIEFLTLCEVERVRRGLSYAEVGRLSDVDRADVWRALNLHGRPSMRTLSRLAETLVSSEYIKHLPLELARESVLYSIYYHCRRLSELTAELARMDKTERNGL